MLLPSESFLCEFVVDIDCGAKNQFTACADPDDDLAESNENNNCLVPPEIVMPEPAALPCAAMALVTILALRRRSVARVGPGLANTVL